MPICQKTGCGYKLLKSWKFCPKCGTPNRDNATYPLRRITKTDEPLSREDWKVIRKLPFTPEDKRDINVFYNSGNRPEPYLGGLVSRANQLFSDHQLCYRIMVSKYARRHHRDPAYYKIFKTVPKEG